MIDLSNVILDNVDLKQANDQNKELIYDIVQALYFNVIMRNTSLFFFRSKHLLDVLNHLSE